MSPQPRLLHNQPIFLPHEGAVAGIGRRAGPAIRCTALPGQDDSVRQTYADVTRIPKLFHLSSSIPSSTALQCTPLFPFPFLHQVEPVARRGVNAAQNLRLLATRLERAPPIPHKKGSKPLPHDQIDHQFTILILFPISLIKSIRSASRTPPRSLPVPGHQSRGRLDGVVVGCSAAGVPRRARAGLRQPAAAASGHGGDRDLGEQRRRQPLRDGHPRRRRHVHLPDRDEGAGPVRQAAGGWHSQGRRRHRQHLAPPADGAEHGGRGGGAAGAGDQGVRGGRPRPGVLPDVRRHARGASPQGLRLLPFHLLGPRHRHALPLHGAPRLLQRQPRLLPGPCRPAARVHVLQGGASPEPSKVGEPFFQHA